MFEVQLTNFGTKRGRFETFEAALSEAKRVYLEAMIVKNKQLVATWSPIGGLRHWNETK